MNEERIIMLNIAIVLVGIFITGLIPLGMLIGMYL